MNDHDKSRFREKMRAAAVLRRLWTDTRLVPMQSNAVLDGAISLRMEARQIAARYRIVGWREVNLARYEWLWGAP
jgi:hypothetical protein